MKAVAAPLARLRQPLERWLFRTGRIEPVPIRLYQRRIFVLPTGAGMAFACALLVMLLASINYNLSLGYALTFLLAGLGVVSMVHAFRNLLGLEIRLRPSAAVFCGEPARFTLQLDNGRDTPRPALQLRAGKVLGERVDAPANDSAEAAIELPSLQRGWLRPGRLILETRYPLGLIRAWSILQPDLRCLVYPSPEKAPPPLPAGISAQDGRPAPTRGEDDFAGLREHHSADSPRHIAWKVVARGGPLLTKQFAGLSGSDVVLDWHALPSALDDEARLARLCAWLLAAHASGQPFSLHLPHTRLPAGSGSAHLHAGLRLLALYGLHDER